MDVTGFDVNLKRIAELVRGGEDHTRETLPEELAGAKIDYTDDPARLAQAAVIIIAVPTPIDAHRTPRPHACYFGEPPRGRQYVQRLRGCL